jgi:hypothetical protein
MVEWKASQKANTFVDKRIGENIPGLTAEEKLFARFRKQQSTQFAQRKKTKFNIDGGDDGSGDDGIPALTHHGKALSNDAGDANEFPSSDDEAGTAMLFH